MKIFIVGLDSAVPELLLGDPQLTNIRRLMSGGCFGRLESIVPPITVPAWMCMAASQDPGSLAVYGFRNRTNRSYDALATVNSDSLPPHTIWDQVAKEGGPTNIVGVPPNFPPRQVNGVSVGCFLTPDTSRNTFALPAAVQRDIERLVGVYPVDVTGFRTHDKERLRRDIDALSRRQWQVVRHLVRKSTWDFFQFVEIGLDRLQHGFWKCHDSRHIAHEPNNPYVHLVRNYYRRLDDEIGQLLELFDEETIVLVASDHGSRPLDGGFCVNEWLLREGLLALDRYPREVTPLSRLAVDWRRTKVWGEGGYYGRIFINVRGREPSGAVTPREYESFRDELKARLEDTRDAEGKRLGTQVFRPEEIYRDVRGVSPDLIVYFGGLAWRSIGGVGYGTVHVQENDTGPDDCNHAQFGAFVLTAPNCRLRGELQGVHLLDIAPTLLELGGYDVPSTMQGRSLAGPITHDRRRNSASEVVVTQQAFGRWPKSVA
jgi:predicted AlkP superfamily phosphohydrolase/phosphomutase